MYRADFIRSLPRRSNSVARFLSGINGSCVEVHAGMRHFSVNPFVVFLLLFGALAPLLEAVPPKSERSFWVISNGFHSSLAFRAGDVPGLPLPGNNGRADYLLIGWGAADYYQGRANPWTFLKAIFWRNRSALHVVPVRGSLRKRFARSDIVRLQLTSGQFAILARELDRSFARDSRGNRILLGPGYFTDSCFYAGSEQFYFPKMCNTWVAQKLHRSGLPIGVYTSFAASELLWQSGKIGWREQWRRRPVDAF